MERLQMSVPLHLSPWPLFCFDLLSCECQNSTLSTYRDVSATYTIYKQKPCAQTHTHSNTFIECAHTYTCTSTHSPLNESHLAEQADIATHQSSLKKVPPGNFLLIWGFPFWAENLFSLGRCAATTPAHTVPPTALNLIWPKQNSCA